MYQYLRNTDDRDVEKFLALLTFLPMDEVKRLGSLEGAEINKAKEVLAFEVTKLIHGEEEAIKLKKQPRHYLLVLRKKVLYPLLNLINPPLKREWVYWIF